MCSYLSFRLWVIWEDYICGLYLFYYYDKNMAYEFSYLAKEKKKRKVAFFSGKKEKEAALAFDFWGFMIGCCLVNHCSKKKEKERGKIKKKEGGFGGVD